MKTRRWFSVEVGLEVEVGPKPVAPVADPPQPRQLTPATDVGRPAGTATA